MKTLARRATIVISATALSIGLMGATSPAEAKKDSSWGYKVSAKKDSSWGYKVASHGMKGRDSSWGY